LKSAAEGSTKYYQTIALATRFWRPGEDYHKQIVSALKGKAENSDIITISEKAISTASGNIIDESPIHASSLARFLAKYWMRFVWGYSFGTFCHLRKKTIERFQTYPIEEGGKHKQLALEKAGFLQALMNGSEGGIDGSNLPQSFVSLPLKNAEQVADQICEVIRTELDRKTMVMIVDTDKTYSFRNFHFTPRPKPIRGIKSHGGIFAYLLGRFLGLKMRSTPIAISGAKMRAEEALQMAEKSNKVRGFGAGRNVWDMAETFSVSLTEVTWEMLERVQHKPIVILRPMVKTHKRLLSKHI
jgi:F420-0:gamma-glutamyl ligase-like protein